MDPQREVQGQKDYDSLVRNMTDEQKGVMQWRTNELLWVADAANRLNGSGKIDPSVDPDTYLAALRMGQISMGQFVTTRFVHAVHAAKTGRITEFVPLFCNGEINCKAREDLQAMAQDWTSPAQYADVAKKWLDETFFTQFFDEMKKLPLSEQQYFVQPVPARCQHQDEWDIYAITQRLLGGLFGEMKGNRRMIPSFGMMQTFLRVLSPQHYVEITPCFLASPLEGIHDNGLQGTRDMGLFDPNFPLPDRADGRAVKENFDFSFHDFYHAVVASLIPHAARVASITLADALGEASEQNSWSEEMKKALTADKARFIDMEHPKYISSRDCQMSWAFKKAVQDMLKTRSLFVGSLPKNAEERRLYSNYEEAIANELRRHE